MNDAPRIACLLLLLLSAPFLRADDDPVAELIGGTRTGSLGCGPRAIYLLLASMGQDIPIEEISAGVDPDGDGVSSVSEIVKFFEGKSFDARFVKCEYPDLLTAKSGIILVLKNFNQDGISHFSLAIVTKQKALTVIDPTVSVNPQPIERSALERMWDGQAILIKKEEL